jgi:Arc/MetJ-type ribon-helix-helix transcriptional regulator
MTIHVSKDAENAINAALQSGRFASADEMIDRLVRDYAQRTRLQTATQPPQAGEAEEKPDPLLGIWQDYAEEMDEIVADAYRKRREESWREFDL